MEASAGRNSLPYYNHDIFAKTAAAVLYDAITSSEQKDAMRGLFDAKNRLEEEHPNNMVLRNAAAYFLFNLSPVGINEIGKSRQIEIIKRINVMGEELAQNGAKKIRPGGHVFVHSLNNGLYGVLAEATKHKKFTVNLVEHSPFNFGKYLKKNLSGTKINLFPDIAMREAIFESDLVLLGGEVIRRDKGAILKAGSKTAAELAAKHNSPVYICAHSWKYDHKSKICDILSHKEEKHCVYEHLPAEMITSYITEHGIYKPEHIVDEIRIHNSWMFI